jgi:hypothetical protein
VIETHQDLLEAYFSSEKGCIFEYSGDIDYDTKALYKECREYAEANGLNTRFLDEELEWFAPNK